MKYCTATLLLLNSFAAGQETSALSLKTHVARPNVDGRMDHFSVDIKGQRLFASALGNNTVEVSGMQEAQKPGGGATTKVEHKAFVQWWRALKRS